MDYRISASRKAAIHRSREIYKNASSIEELYAKKVLSSNVQQMLFQSAVVMACASVEQYLVSFFDDWLINLQKAKFKHVPSSLKTYFLMSRQRTSMKKLVVGGDEMQFIKETDINQQYYSVLNERRLIKNIVDFKNFKFYAGRTFPSENNIKKLFSIIGLPRVFDELKSVSNRSFVFILNSFLDVRNAIAHRQAPDLTIDDMRNHLSAIRAFVLYLDKVLFWHLDNISDTAFWPSAS